MLQEDRQAIIWEMKDAAKALSKADKLENYRNAYFQDLYDDIALFSVRYSDITDARGFNPSVESQALHIIDSKDAYDMKISKLKAKHDRWRTFLQPFDGPTAAIIEQYVLRNGKGLEGALKQVFDDALKEWDAAEKVREKMEDKAAKAQLIYMKKKHPALFVERSREQKYLIDGELISMTEFDYEMQLRKKEEAAQEKKWQAYLSHRANEQRNAL